VELPTGGNFSDKRARERFLQEKVSRFGEIPKPTVKVRMKEELHNNALMASSFACLEEFFMNGMRSSMFNGIIEAIGTVTHLEYDVDAIHLTLSSPYSDLYVGESVAVNGVCLTVVETHEESFKVTVVKETLRVTNFSDIKINDKVNLERSLPFNGRISGHYVQGHVDCIGEIIHIHEESIALLVTIRIPYEFQPYIVNKGYIALDGMSITVIKVEQNEFTVTFIPHTQKVTVIPQYKKGSKINIEVDILSKYVKKQLEGFNQCMPLFSA
jgi:riboflavin synthase